MKKPKINLVDEEREASDKVTFELSSNSTDPK